MKIGKSCEDWQQFQIDFIFIVLRPRWEEMKKVEVDFHFESFFSNRLDLHNRVIQLLCAFESARNIDEWTIFTM